MNIENGFSLKEVTHHLLQHPYVDEIGMLLFTRTAFQSLQEHMIVIRQVTKILESDHINSYCNRIRLSQKKKKGFNNNKNCTIVNH